MTDNTDPKDLRSKLDELVRYGQMALEGSPTAQARLFPLTAELLTTLVAEGFGQMPSTSADNAQEAAPGGSQSTDEVGAVVDAVTTALTSIGQLGQAVFKLSGRQD